MLARRLGGLLCAAAWGIACAASQAQDTSPGGRPAALAGLSLEELGDVPVTSVSGRAERWQDAPASVYVITGEDIRRSGAVTLPQVLRLAPNLQVASLNAGQYAISARGFNTAIANKLLVMIDGRTVYSPLFSGVLWDAQAVVLEDIERIEVISGPGGTLWGANAVNGVINIVTRTAAATQGWMVSGAGGGQGSQASARYGARLGELGQFRVSLLRHQHDNTRREDGVELADASSTTQLGFRGDWADEHRTFSLQGQAYEGGTPPGNNTAPVLRGHHLLARYGQQLGGGGQWSAQAYVDSAERDEPVLFRDRTRVTDLRLDHGLPVLGRHRLLWGINIRQAISHTEPTLVAAFLPADQRLRWSSVYLQDELQLAPHWHLTGGLKLERNSYTGWEWMPNLRLAWRPGDARQVWAGLSRAVRAPSRIDREFYFPASPPYLIQGGADFRSEVALVAELGLRGRLGSDWSYSATVYRQQYDDLRGGTDAPTAIENRIGGHADGLEAWAGWQAAAGWRLSGGLLTQHKSLQGTPGTNASSVANLGNDPSTQWSLRSSHNLPGRQELDIFVRHISALPQPAVAAYTATDVRWGWRVTPTAELSLSVVNAFDAGHVELEPLATASVQRRQIWLKLVLRSQPS